MKALRALWHPLVPPALVLVVLPLAILAGPAEQRPGWFLLLFAVGSPLAAVASALSLRRALGRIPVPPDAPPESARERTLARALRWLLVLVTVLGPLALLLVAASVAAGSLAGHRAVLLCLVPLLFAALGVRLWADLSSARRRRARGLAPLPFPPPSWTGDQRLDQRLGKRPRTAARITWMVGFTSALAYISPGHSLLAQLAEVNDAVWGGEVWRLLTATLVHGDLLGLLVSGLSFFVVAPLVELLLGPRWLVGGFLCGGVAAAAASAVFVPANYMGSTGAVAALTGLLLFFAAVQHRRLPRPVARRIALHGLVALLVLGFAGALLPFADSAAHLGGFLFGALLGLLVRPGPAVRSALEQVRAEAT